MTHRVVYYDDANAPTDSLVVILKATAEDIAKNADIDAAKMLDRLLGCSQDLHKL